MGKFDAAGGLPPPEMAAKLVADIVGTGGLGVQLRDDWSWAPLPGQREDVLMRAILDDLAALGLYGRPVPNLHDTAVGGSTIVPGGEVVKWWGDHSRDRDEAIARYRREEGGPAGGPIP